MLLFHAFVVSPTARTQHPFARSVLPCTLHVEVPYLGSSTARMIVLLLLRQSPQNTLLEAPIHSRESGQAFSSN